MYQAIRIGVYLACFIFSFYACGCIRYEELLHTHNSGRVVLFQILIAMSIAYCVGSFLLVMGGY